MSRTILVDADIFAYVASSATQGTFHFTPGSPPATSSDPEEAIRITRNAIEDVANKLKATRIIVCLTDDTNFRSSVYPLYKQNRKDVEKPEALLAVKAWYAEHYECYRRPGLEADDCMGILATHPKLVPGEKIIVSSDKDMKTIPGLLFNPQKDRKKPRRITPIAANRYFFEQTITGDATDGYPGAKGVGPKSPFVAALATARSLGQMWKIVLDAYASKGFTPEDALQQARCARILRATDWDFEKRAPRLWCPPKIKGLD